MLETDPLLFSYPASPPLNFPSIKVGTGEALLILGASGTGKSTWLQLLAGQRVPKQGKVFINGKDLHALSAGQRNELRRKDIGFVFQEQHFVPSLSAMDNLRLSFFRSDFPLKRARELAEHLGIYSLLHKKPQHLSQGEKQRLGIVRALLPQPSVVFADEPSSSLDDANCEALALLLKEQCAAAGCALVVVTHDQRISRHFERRIQR